MALVKQRMSVALVPIMVWLAIWVGNVERGGGGRELRPENENKMTAVCSTKFYCSPLSSPQVWDHKQRPQVFFSLFFLLWFPS